MKAIQKRNIFIIFLVVLMVLSILAGCKNETAEISSSKTSSTIASSNSASVNVSSKIESPGVENITNVFTISNEFCMPTFKHLTYFDSNASRNMPYSLFLPEDYEEGKQYPVLLFLHGAGEVGNDYTTATRTLETLYKNNADIVRNAIVIVPQCPSGNWWHLDEGGHEKGWLGSVMRLLFHIEDTYKCDKNRIYIMGLSMGGYGTWSALQRYPDHFAAGVPICGGGDFTQAYKLTNTPIWIYHGIDDDIVSINNSQRMYDAIIDSGGTKVKFTRLKNVKHSSWINAFSDRELLSWMFAQDKSKNYSDKYEIIPLFSVKDSSGKTIISEFDAKDVSFAYGDFGKMNISLKLTANGVKKLEKAYTKSNGNEFTAYCGNKKLVTFTASQKPKDDSFVIVNCLRTQDYFDFYNRLRKTITE